MNYVIFFYTLLTFLLMKIKAVFARLVFSYFQYNVVKYLKVILTPLYMDEANIRTTINNDLTLCRWAFLGHYSYSHLFMSLLPSIFYWIFIITRTKLSKKFSELCSRTPQLSLFQVHTLVRCSSKSEAIALDLLERLEEMFQWYHTPIPDIKKR